MELLPWAQKEAESFQNAFEDHSCTCFLSAPCNFCTHPGNPMNLEETEDAWGTTSEVMLAEAYEWMPDFINRLAAQHLKEMRESWKREATTEGGGV